MTRPPETLVVRASVRSMSDDAIEVLVDDGAGGPRTLSYTSREPLWTTPPPVLDFAAVALAPYVAALGADLLIDGPVTTSQLDRLDQYVRTLASWRPDVFASVSLAATDEVAEPDRTGRAGTVMAFSGGVDSSHALAACSRGDLGRLTGPVDLGVLVIGWDIDRGDDDAVHEARGRAERRLSAHGARLAVVETNWKDEFCPAWAMTHGSGLAAVLQTFAGEFSSARCAAGRQWRDDARLPAYLESLSGVQLLGRPGFPLTTVGSTLRRIDKVAYVAEDPAALRDLRVCAEPTARGGNCGHCEKCVRTQLELMACGSATDAAFPDKMTGADLDRATASGPSLLHFEDVLDRLPEIHRLHGPLRDWVSRERLAASHRRDGPLVRVPEREAELDELRLEVAAARREVDDLHGSHSWRVTRPLRLATDAVRAVRSRR